MKTKQQVSAEQFASTSIKLWGLTSICATVLSLGSGVFAADTQLIVPSDRVNQAVYGAAANYDSYAQQRPEDLAYIKYVIELYRRRPNTDPQQVIAHIDEARRRFQDQYQRGDPSPPGQPRSGIPRYDWFNGAIDILSSFPFAEYTFVPLILTSSREARTLSETLYHRAMAPIYRLDSLLQQGVRTETERFDNRRAFDEAFALAQNNPKAAAVLQSVMGRSASQSAQQMIAGNPALASNPIIQTLQSLMNERGEIVASIEQLKTLFGNELQNLQDTMNSNLSLVTDLAARQNVLYRYMLNAEQQRVDQERIAQEQAVYEQKVKAANASVYILSSLVGFNNPELGHQMQIVGNSTVQIADALHNFAKADALGSVILTGNMLGAVMSVVSLFSETGPTPDQQILEGIRQLQQMVQQLRVEMHERFDRVDAALNQIYATMNERFDRIDITLGILRGDVEEIQQSLYNLQSDLYRIERKVFAFLDAGFRRDLNETINGYLGYYETYSQPIPWLSYVFAENKFHTWAVNNALDEISSGSAGRGYDAASLYAELNSQPLENNFNYISQYLATKGWPSFTTVRLANPRDWAIAANSWIELASESPMFFRQVSSNRLEQIYRVGVDLQRAVTNITLVQGNPLPVGNRALFNALFANYRAKATVFKLRLSDKEEEFRLSISPDSTRRDALAALNPWGGPTQTTSWRPGLSAVPPHANDLTHGLTTSLVAPTDWQQMVPPSCFLAELLGVAQLAVGWGDYDVTNRYIGPVFNLGQRCDGWVGTLQIALKGEMNGRVVFNRVFRHYPFATVNNIAFGYEVPDLTIGCNNGFSYTRDWLFWLGLWNIGGGGIKDAFVRDSVNQGQENTTDSLNYLADAIDGRLRNLQRGSYNHVLTALEQAGNLQSAAQEFTGAKVLLDSFIVLGFSESLEGNDFVHSLLSGSERVLDVDAIKAALTNGIAMTFDTNQNAKVDIAVILDERINALETWVSNRLTQVETNGRAESLRLVSSTLSRLDAFRALWHQPSPAPYVAPLGLRVTNGVPNRLFIVWGEPNLRYVVQISTDLSTWTDLLTPADEGTDYITTPTTRSAFYRAVLRP